MINYFNKIIFIVTFITFSLKNLLLFDLVLSIIAFKINGRIILDKLLNNFRIIFFIFKNIYFLVKVVRPIFFPSIKDDEQCNLVLSKINMEPNSHS